VDVWAGVIDTVGFKSVEVIFQGLFGIGFTFMILSYLFQRYEEIAMPIFIGLGMSMLGGQMFDIINYGVEWLLPIGVVCMLIATVIWAANWG
jgi:hypothetical protein